MADIRFNLIADYDQFFPAIRASQQSVGTLQKNVESVNTATKKFFMETNSGLNNMELNLDAVAGLAAKFQLKDPGNLGQTSAELQKIVEDLQLAQVETDALKKQFSENSRIVQIAESNVASLVDQLKSFNATGRTGGIANEFELLAAQILNANGEVDQAVQKFGLLSQEAIDAQANVNLLTNEYSILQQTLGSQTTTGLDSSVARTTNELTTLLDQLIAAREEAARIGQQFGVDQQTVSDVNITVEDLVTKLQSFNATSRTSGLSNEFELLDIKIKESNIAVEESVLKYGQFSNEANTARDAVERLSRQYDELKNSLSGIESPQIKDAGTAQVVSDLRNMIQELIQARAEADRLKDSFGQNELQIEQSEIRVTELTTALQNFGASAKTNGLANEFDLLAAKVTDSNTAADQAVIKYGEFSDEAIKAREEAKKLESEYEVLKDTLTKDNDNLGDGFAKAGMNMVSLRSQLSAAKNEMAAAALEFGEGSEQFLVASQKAAVLQNRIEDLNRRINALNPEEKFTVVAQLAGNIAGAFTGATAALQLFGAQSDELKAGLQKIQNILVFAQGVNSVLQLSGSFKNLTAVLGITRAATIGQAAAATGASGATALWATVTNAATTATRGLTAAIVANPLTALAVAAAAVVSALIIFNDEEEDLKKNLDEVTEATNRQVQGFGDISSAYVAHIGKVKELAQAQGATANRIKELELIQLDEVKKSTEQRIEIYQNEVNVRRASLDKLSGEDRQASAKRILDLEQKIETDKQFVESGFKDDLSLILQEFTNKQKSVEEQLGQARIAGIKNRADRETAVVLNQLEQDINNIKLEGQQATELRKQLETNANEQIIEIHRQYNKDVQAIEIQRQETIRSLSTKFEQERVNNLTGLTKLDAEKAIAQKEVDLFKTNLEKTLINERDQLLKLQGSLTAEQEKQFRLSAQQLQIFDNLKLEIDKRYAQQRINLLVQSETALASLLGTERQKAIDQFSTQFDEQANKALEGIDPKSQKFIQTTIDLQVKKNEGIQKIDDQFRIQNIQKEEQYLIDRENTVERSGQNEQEFERNKEISIINIKIQAASAQLSVLKGRTDDEAKLQMASLRAFINQAHQQIDQIEKSAPKKDLFDLLGITFRTDQLKQEIKDALNSIISSAQQVVNTLFQSDIDDINRRIAANEEYKRSLEERVSTTQTALDIEQENFAKGRANNVVGREDELRKLNTLEEESNEKDKRLKEELLKRKRQQVAANAVLQASQLLVASANTITSATEQGGVYGFIIGLAAVAGLLAGFASITQSLKNVSNDEFLHGGYTGDGNKYEEAGTVHKKEFVHTEETTTKHRVLFEKIHRKEKITLEDLSTLDSQELNQIIERSGITMNGDNMQVKEKAIEVLDKDQQQDKELHVIHVDNSGVEKRLEMVDHSIKDIKKELAKPKTHFLSDGTVIHVRGNHVKVIRSSPKQ